MTDMFKPTLQDEIECVKREIGMRENVYPKWVAAGKMKQEKADRELQLMRSIKESGIVRFKA